MKEEKVGEGSKSRTFAQGRKNNMRKSKKMYPESIPKSTGNLCDSRSFDFLSFCEVYIIKIVFS